MFLKFSCNPDINLATRQIIGYGILDIVDISHPIIAADIRDVKHIEKIEAYAQRFEMTEEILFNHSLFRSAYNHVGYPYVDPFI